MIRSLKSLFLVGLVGLPDLTMADEGRALDALYWVCMGSSMTNNVIRDFAVSMRWRAMDDAMLAPMLPPAPQKYMQGWLASDGSNPPYRFLVMIAEPAEAPETETCGLFLPDLSPTELLDQLVKESGATEVDRIDQMGTRNVLLTIPAFSGVISITYSLRAGAEDVTIFVVHPKALASP